MEINIDLSKVVGDLMGVAMRPYFNFIRHLHQVGRITDDELAQVNKEFMEHLESGRFVDLVREKMREINTD